VVRWKKRYRERSWQKWPSYYRKVISIVLTKRKKINLIEYYLWIFRCRSFLCYPYKTITTAEPKVKVLWICWPEILRKTCQGPAESLIRLCSLNFNFICSPSVAKVKSFSTFDSLLNYHKSKKMGKNVHQS